MNPLEEQWMEKFHDIMPQYDPYGRNLAMSNRPPKDAVDGWMQAQQNAAAFRLTLARRQRTLRGLTLGVALLVLAAILFYIL